MQRGASTAIVKAMRSLERTDALVALGLLAVAVLQVTWFLPIATVPVGLVVAAGTTLPIAWRRPFPVTAALAGSFIWLVPTDGYIVVGYVAAFALYYSVGAYVPETGRVVAVVAVGIGLGTAAAAMRDEEVGEYLGAVTVAVAPAAVGRFVRHERGRTKQLADLAHSLEVERHRSARVAVAEERARIARELHDVVSHGIGAIAVQSDAAEAALDRDPDLARRPLASIRGSAREALDEMRRLLGMLREAGEPPAVDPLPGLAQVSALVERTREAGMPVTLEMIGEPQPVPASIDLSAYRIVQEALTNIRKHAGSARSDVTIAWEPGALRLEIRDRGPGPRANNVATEDGGHGLVGMRERVRLHRGSLEAGPAPEGGFAVRAVLPLPEAP